MCVLPLSRQLSPRVIHNYFAGMAESGIQQGGKQVFPTRIRCFNEIDLPLPKPFLHGLFPLDCKLNVLEVFLPDKLRDLVPRREAWNFLRLVLHNA